MLCMSARSGSRQLRCARIPDRERQLVTHVRLPGVVAVDGPGDPDPYENLAWLRSAMPVAAVAGSGGTVWFVTDYEQCRACLADKRLSNELRHAANGGNRPQDEGDLLGKDPPEHSRLRQLVNPVLSPGASERFRPIVTKICESLIDSFAGLREAEIVGQYAWPIPWAVIHEFFGIPDAERMEASRCIDRFIVAGYFEERDGGPATDELMGYIQHLIAYKRAHRGEDFSTRMIEGREQGTVRTDTELREMLYTILGAGLVSTGPMIAAAILRLLENPSELAKSVSGEVGWGAVVEEALRYDSPVQTTVARYALADIQLGPVRIAKGDTVVISLAAANRDPGHYAEADQFRVGQRRSHLAFGHGIHLCVGAPLARLEGQIALATVFRRLQNLRLAAPSQERAWILGPKLRSPREIPVVFDHVCH